MTPVYQTVVDVNKGNCMQAAFASLFDLPLESVPHFKLMGDDWFQNLWDFIKAQGYEYDGLINNPRDLGAWGQDTFIKDLKENGGVNGYFYAVVYSPKYFDPVKLCDTKAHCPTHAVIIDTDGNIAHDPNEAYKGLEKYPLADFIAHNGVKYAYLLKKLTNNG